VRGGAAASVPPLKLVERVPQSASLKTLTPCEGEMKLQARLTGNLDGKHPQQIPGRTRSLMSNIPAGKDTSRTGTAPS
jgi:hypothetical protein